MTARPTAQTSLRSGGVRRQVLAALAACLFVQPMPLDAARTCSITVSGLAFGNYPPATPTPVDSTALIQVQCVGNPDPGQLGYVIRIDGGSSGDPASRFMPSGPSQLDYNLYQDPARTTVWGDGTSGTLPVVQLLPGGMGMGMGMGMGGGMGMGMGMGITVNHTVYGRSFASQDPAPGAYSDTPIVTIEF